jgi:hypothetical protein
MGDSMTLAEYFKKYAEANGRAGVTVVRLDFEAGWNARNEEVKALKACIKALEAPARDSGEVLPTSEQAGTLAEPPTSVRGFAAQLHDSYLSTGNYAFSDLEDRIVAHDAQLLATYKAHIERVRGALEDIVSILGTGACGAIKSDGCATEMNLAAQTARAALEEKE